MFSPISLNFEFYKSLTTDIHLKSSIFMNYHKFIILRLFFPQERLLTEVSTDLVAIVGCFRVFKIKSLNEIFVNS